MKLNTKKIIRLKKAQNLTWQQLANKMGLKSRQHAYDYILNKRVTGAEKFAKALGVDTQDLIIF